MKTDVFSLPPSLPPSPARFQLYNTNWVATYSREFKLDWCTVDVVCTVNKDTLADLQRRSSRFTSILPEIVGQKEKFESVQLGGFIIKIKLN